MFSQADIDYRSGIALYIGRKEYTFTLQCFMSCFVTYMQTKINTTMRSIPKIERGVDPIPVAGFEQLLRASQSIIAGPVTRQLRVEDPKSYFKFLMNGREIQCPHDSHCYVYDELLRQQYPDIFPEADISYMRISHFLKKAMKEQGISDSVLARNVIGILIGAPVPNTHFEVLPLMLAAIFLAEPKRNPSCFIPNLMLVELIEKGYFTPFGDPYSWENSLQSSVLACSAAGVDVDEEEDDDYIKGHLWPSYLGLPLTTQSNQMFHLSEREKTLLNACKKHNGTKNQVDISGVDYHMQLGGYFPGSHRFSFAEIEPKRSKGIDTLSDKKSFIIITDWLTMLGVAEPLDKTAVHKKRVPSIDSQKAVLMEYVFPKIWNVFFKNEELDFNINVSPMKYPRLLNAYGCSPSKASLSRVANAIFLIHGSRRPGLGPEKAREVKRQFYLWSINTNGSFGVNEVEDKIEKTYSL